MRSGQELLSLGALGGARAPSSDRRAKLPWVPLGASLGAASLTRCPTDMEFLEVLTEGLERVLLVRGGGREVITIYS